MRKDSSKKPVPTVLVGTGTDASLAMIESSKTLFARMRFSNMPSTEDIIARGPHKDALKTTFAWSRAEPQERPHGREIVAFAEVNDVALDEERKALHREKIAYWDDPDAKFPPPDPATIPPRPVATNTLRAQTPSTQSSEPVCGTAPAC